MIPAPLAPSDRIAKGLPPITVPDTYVRYRCLTDCTAGGQRCSRGRVYAWEKPLEELGAPAGTIAHFAREGNQAFGRVSEHQESDYERESRRSRWSVRRKERARRRREKRRAEN